MADEGNASKARPDRILRRSRRVLSRRRDSGDAFSGLLYRSGVVFVGNGASKFLLLGFEFLIAAERGAAVLGLYAICYSLLLLGGQMAVMATNYGIVNFLGEYQERGESHRIRRLIQGSLLLVGAVGVLIGFIVFAARGVLADSAFGRGALPVAIGWVSLAIPFEAINQALGAVFRGLRRPQDHVIVSDLGRNIVLVVALPLLAGGAGIGAFGLALFVGTALGTVYGAFRVGTILRRLPRSALASRRVELSQSIGALLSFSWLLTVWNVFQALGGRLQILVAATFLSAGEVGVLASFLRILTVLTFLQSVVNHSAPVEFARLRAQGATRELRRVYQQVSQLLMAAALFVSLPLLAQPKLFLGWLGSDFRAAGLLLVPVVACQILDVGTGPMGQLLIASDQRVRLFWTSVLGAGVQLGLTLLLTPRYGLSGAVTAECATITSVAATRQWIGARALGVHCFTARWAAIVGLGTGCLLVGVGSGIVADGLFGGDWRAAGVLVVELVVLIALTRSQQFAQVLSSRRR